MSGPRQDGARTAPGIAVLDGLSEVVDTPCTRLLVARDDAALLGMLTLVLVRLPTGLVGHVEDVVVAGGARGKRPPTTSTGLGFHRRDTNVYRYVIAHDGLGT